MNDIIPIMQEDVEKIAKEVEQFRLTLTRLYQLGYLQGQIDLGAKVTGLMKEPA